MSWYDANTGLAGDQRWNFCETRGGSERFFKDKPKCSSVVEDALNAFYEASRDRTYTGQYSLPNPLSSNVIENAANLVYNNHSKDDLIKIIKAIDSYYVNNKIEAFNKKAKEK
jgi:hypothetical protein